MTLIHLKAIALIGCNTTNNRYFVFKIVVIVSTI